MSEMGKVIDLVIGDRKRPVPLNREQMEVVRKRILMALASQLFNIVEDETAGRKFYLGDTISFKAELNAVIDTYLMFDREGTP